MQLFLPAATDACDLINAQDGAEFHDVVAARAEDGKPIAEEHVARWTLQIASGLRYLHEESGLVHQASTPQHTPQPSSVS